jgi:hypothetical protein
MEFCLNETEMVYNLDDIKSDNKLEKLKSIFEADDPQLNISLSRNVESYQADFAFTVVALNHQFF